MTQRSKSADMLLAAGYILRAYFRTPKERDAAALANRRTLGGGGVLSERTLSLTRADVAVKNA